MLASRAPPAYEVPSPKGEPKPAMSTTPPTEETPAKPDDYGAKSITALEGLEAVRKRP